MGYADHAGTGRPGCAGDPFEDWIPAAVGLILGTGLGGLAEAIQKTTIIHIRSYRIGLYPLVQGHAGQLVIGELEGQQSLAMQGRIHYYEGYTMPAGDLAGAGHAAAGIEILIVTNAAGAISPGFHSWRCDAHHGQPQPYRDGRPEPV